MKKQRKLAAIMFTDIVGYTALMSKDEQHAHQIIHKSREILKQLIEQYNGEWLQAVGDATLSSFASVVDSVNCALEIQRTLRDEPELSLRIGIHIGDVVFEEGEIYGDGVNVASRLEPLAEPGGICISGQVYRNVRNRPGIEAVCLGEKTLKNVDLPMKVYALIGEGLSTPSLDIISAEESGLGKPLGKTVSHYHLLLKLGEGRMGAVYKAEDTKLKRTVALKFLRTEVLGSEEQKTRFVNEARLGAALDHTNICVVHEIVEFEGHTFIAMAHIDGQNLKDKIASGPLEVDEVINLALQVAQGLKEAHEQRIIHRDIKSANIMVSSKGQVKITDFGLAKLTGRTQITKKGTIMGTVAYMSPEQACGKAIDIRTDIWSLGVVLYEMLTGQLPFAGEHEQAVIYSILNVEPEPLTKTCPGVPKELERVVNKALAKSPDKRYQTVSELQDDLKQLTPAKTPAPATISSTVAVHLKRCRQHARPLAVVIAALLLLLIPIGWPTLQQWLGFERIPWEKHLLVLPITNVGGNATHQAFCDGLVETLTSKLTQLQQFQGSLWVVPAADVRESRIASAGAALQWFGVHLVVAGSMQRLGDGFRLTLNLVDTKTLRQLRSEVITDRMTNITALQDGIVLKLAEMLALEMQPESRGVLTAGHTTVPGAYEFYLQGRGYLQEYVQDRQKTEKLINTAISLFERAIDQDSRYALAYAGLGEAYWRKYRATKDTQWIEHAVRNCEHAVELNDLLAPVHVALGMVQRGTGRYEEAIMEFQLALKLNPLSAEGYRELAEAYRVRGRLPEAELTYQKAIELKPDYWAGYNKLGVFYFQQGRYEEAAAQFRHVIEMKPLNPKGYRNLGGIYFFLERMEDAEEMFQRSLEIEPDYRTFSNLATIYFNRERYTDAARMFEKALELEDHDYRIWGYLASACYWTPDERDRAWIIYQRGITMAEEQMKVNPRDPELQSNLALYCAMVGEQNKARTYLQQTADLESNILEVIFRMGNTYEILGEREQALQWIEKALENGYSLSEVKRIPGLRDLREDQRFQLMLQHIEDKTQKERRD